MAVSREHPRLACSASMSSIRATGSISACWVTDAGESREIELSVGDCDEDRGESCFLLCFLFDFRPIVCMRDGQSGHNKSSPNINTRWYQNLEVDSRAHKQ